MLLQHRYVCFLLSPHYVIPHLQNTQHQGKEYTFIKTTGSSTSHETARIIRNHDVHHRVHNILSLTLSLSKISIILLTRYHHVCHRYILILFQYLSQCPQNCLFPFDLATEILNAISVVATRVTNTSNFILLTTLHNLLTKYTYLHILIVGNVFHSQIALQTFPALFKSKE